MGLAPYGERNREIGGVSSQEVPLSLDRDEYLSEDSDGTAGEGGRRLDQPSGAQHRRLARGQEVRGPDEGAGRR